MLLLTLQAFRDETLPWLIVLVAMVVFFYNLRLWIIEVRLLRRTLVDILPKGRITSRDDLIRLKDFLSQHIHFDEKKKYEERPILRQSALTTLKLGHGFCGENARVAILLMAMGGVRANRIYLVGPQWGHVAVEHEWKDGWKFFDAHADPSVYLNDESVTQIDSQDLKSLPNAYSDINPWQCSYRIPFFHRLPVLNVISQLRLPRPLIFFFESPTLICACLAAVVLGCFSCMI
jgi:hypothetical protein